MNAPRNSQFRYVTTHKIAGSCGAVVEGVDLSEDLPDDVLAEVRAALLDNCVIFFRDQKLTPEQQLNFARRWGEIHLHPFMQGMADYPEILEIIKTPQDKKNFGGSWHTDQMFSPAPAMGTILYALEVPSSGGDTLFLNMYKAYDTLPAELKARIDGRKALNAYLYDSTTRAVNGSKVDFTAHPHYVQPIVRTHPDTRRKALYVNRLMTFTIEGMDEDDGSALLDSLFDHIEQDQFIYAHHWRPGDLVLWDNRCTLHARTDFSDKERRLLRRYVVMGDRVF